MTVYNAALPLVKQGKLEYERLNRGLGLALTKKFRKDHGGYDCTDSQCNCPDAMQRWVTCKHQIAVAILKVAREIERKQRKELGLPAGAKLPSAVQQRRQRNAVPGAGWQLPSGNPRRTRTRTTKRPAAGSVVE